MMIPIGSYRQQTLEEFWDYFTNPAAKDVNSDDNYL